MTRKPEFLNAPRMQPIDVLPLFHKLKGEKVIVAGLGEPAFWKAELMAASGAMVDFYHGSSQLPQTQIANLNYISRNWQAEDLEGARIAILGSDDLQEANEFKNAARKYGASVNIIDKPELCDFQFGAIVNRSPLVIGISTDGAAPALGQQIRGRLEAIFPQKIVNWLRIAQKLRPIIKTKELDFSTRRSFWHKFATQTLDNPSAQPDEAQIIEALNQTQTQNGEVILLGAGPGDAELLTLKAVRALQRADVIMFDDLVSNEVLDFARREAQLINVGKRGGKPSVPQQEICQMLVDFAKQGKIIARVKGGDSLVFGRATEEIMACRENNIKIELVPGISAAQGAAASLGISLTDRLYSKRVQFVTAHSAKGDLPDDINWAAIVAKDVTTCVYMPRKTIGEFVQNAIMAGIDANTKAAIIINASRQNQTNIFCKFNELVARFEKLENTGPEMVIIGNILENISEA
jgi:uroporphyrin-III C-methyltransferase / precorrin-2 dehydrogenase / sirohydrochlorin ferrochelatase